MSTATLTSTPVRLESVDRYSIQAVYTGAPVGSLKLQASNDPLPTGTGAAESVTNWTDITGSTEAVAAAGSSLWVDLAAVFQWVRVYYTKTSGTGTLSARIVVKGERR
jgi:hypothetical protein